MKLASRSFDALLAAVTEAARRSYEGDTADERADGLLDLDWAYDALRRLVEPDEDEDAADAAHADARLYERRLSA